VNMAKPTYPAFAISASGLDRLDVSYSLARASSSRLEARVPLADVAVELRYGTSTRATVEQLGVPIVRMGNISDGAVDLEELKYVQLQEKNVERYRLRMGDILINRTNTKDLVGKSAVWDLAHPFVFASYIIRLRVDPSSANPSYVSAWLNSADARRQIDKVSRQAAGMTNLNSQDIRALRMPWPDISTQGRLATRLEDAREDFKSALAHAAQLLSASSEYVQVTLGLDIAAVGHNLSYAVPRELISLMSRLDVRHNHPTRLAALRAIAAHPNARLDDIVDIVSVKTEPDADEFCVGLGDISSHTGMLTNHDASSRRPMSGALAFRTGDVLYARLRPELNKVWLADRPGCCSPEFRVLRVRSGVDSGFVAAILRSDVVLNQTRYVSTGNTHPRITDEDLLDTVVPVPSNEQQRAISSFVSEQQRAAFSIEAVARDRWESAKQAFARDALLAAGGSPS
jgi:type I restriction enzyme S subunit